MFKQYLGFVLYALISLPAFAQTNGSASLSDLEQAQKYDEALRALERAKSTLNDLVASRNMACMRAVGYAPFCSCLAKDMPVAFSFDEYIAITTKSKEQNGYASLPADTRKAYDIVPSIRDRCVNIFPRSANARK
jgi:hypothetical protein